MYFDADDVWFMAMESTGSEDGIAIAQRFARLRPDLVVWFRRRIGEPAEAEDLAQECYVRIAGRADPQAVEHFEGYVFKTAKSVLFDRSRRRRAREANSHVSMLPEHDIAEDNDTLRTLLAQERLRRVSAVLVTMPERTRSIFILSRIEGMRYAEIGTRFGISVSAVQKHMLRAIETLLLSGEAEA